MATQLLEAPMLHRDITPDVSLVTVGAVIESRHELDKLFPPDAVERAVSTLAKQRAAAIHGSFSVPYESRFGEVQSMVTSNRWKGEHERKGDDPELAADDHLANTRYGNGVPLIAPKEEVVALAGLLLALDDAEGSERQAILYALNKRTGLAHFEAEAKAAARSGHLVRSELSNDSSWVNFMPGESTTYRPPKVRQGQVIGTDNNMPTHPTPGKPSASNPAYSPDHTSRLEVTTAHKILSPHYNDPEFWDVDRGDRPVRGGLIKMGRRIKDAGHKLLGQFGRDQLAKSGRSVHIRKARRLAS